MKPIRIYLAGKMSPNWREELVEYCRDNSQWGCFTSEGGFHGGIGPQGLCLSYVGPIVLCKAAGGHRASKGVYHTAKDKPQIEDEDSPELFGDEGVCTGDLIDIDSVVWEENTKSLIGCDLVFAHITSPDCYGTIAELGWASAFNKYIFINYAWPLSAPIVREFWFVERFAADVACGLSAKEGFRRAIEQYQKEFDPTTIRLRKLLLSNDWKGLYSTPQWQAFKAKVFGDGRPLCCAKCGTTTALLDVHHTFYVRGKFPWEYDTKDLQLLCRSCHPKGAPTYTDYPTWSHSYRKGYR